MHINRLTLYHFRNLKDCVLEFPPGVSFIIGKNGQGKTNILEAIGALSTGRSFRTAQIRELTAWNESESSIFGTVERAGTETELGVAISNGRRKTYINQEEQRSIADFVGNLLTVSFSPLDLEIVRGAPALRRQFLDKHTVDLNPGLLRHLMQYQRALRHKQALLRARERDQALLEPWNQMLSEAIQPIRDSRARFIEELAARADRYYQSFSRGGDGKLELRFERKEPPPGSSWMDYFTTLAPRELAAGSALAGVHRDDMSVLLGGNEARSFASQGQMRSIVLSFKLAVVDLIETVRGETPIVLLDDVESELDESRVAALLGLIFGRGRQVVMTGTELRFEHHLEDRDYRLYEVRSGTANCLK